MSFHDMPLWLVFAITTLVVVLGIEVGYQFGELARRRATEEQDSPVAAIAASVLGLLAFMLAFTFGISAERYQARSELVRDEAAAIGTSYYRSEFLPEPARTDAKALYDEYLTLLIHAADPDRTEELADVANRLQTIQAQLWEIGSEDMRRADSSPLAAAYIQSLIDMSNLLSHRLQIGVQARLPAQLWYVLYGLMALGMIALGYQTAIAASRRSWIMVLLAMSFCIVITLIAALDNPERGYLSVPHRALVDLQVEIQQHSAHIALPPLAGGLPAGS